MHQSNPNRRRSAPKQSTLKADVVRTRRSTTTSERLEKRIHQIKQSSASVPVITMRKGMLGTPVVQRTSSHPRLKLNLELSKPGVEMRLPAIPVIKPGWRILSGLLVIIFSAMIFYLTTSNEFVVKAPQIKGLNRLSSADLEAALFLNGSRIFMVDPQEVKTTLEASFPELKQVSVDVSFPAKVTIQATERQPVITWKYQDVVMWIDNEGIIFPARGDAQTLLTISSDAAPPMVTSGYKPALLASDDSSTSAKSNTDKPEVKKTAIKLVDRKVLNMAISLSRKVPANTTLVYNKTSGLGWLDSNGWDVYIGFDLDQLDQKMLVYNKLVDTLTKQGLHPKVISVEYVNAPYYRLE